ncbi:MAG TPA: radical SAM protein [Anaerolineaceae bacterium]|nr:radical SAM protein [Anaerolineaceae bacterium]
MQPLSALKARLSGITHQKDVDSDPRPGVYHFLREEHGAKTRVHLRMDPDGRGFILINASQIFHLNPTGLLMAYLILSKSPRENSLRTLQRRFDVARSQAEADYDQFESQFSALIDPDGGCPIHDLNVETVAPFSARPSAPYRMDLAITYRCNNNCAHCYNARPRHYTELTTEQWKKILDRLWDIAIPHIVFTGGEPTLRADLPELIAYAEHKGQITGLNTNGRRLKDPAYLQSLVDAGLDHVQITLESHNPTIHDEMVAARGAWQDTVVGLKNALTSKLYVMTNTTLLKNNSPHLAETLAFLTGLGVPTFGLNALIYSGKGEKVGTGLPETSLPPLLEMARNHVAETNQRLIWYTPTQYCHFDPMQLELGVKGCTAALYNMCVEPDGSVLPCQSYYVPLGNLLVDPWKNIWEHSLAVSLRERKDLPADCKKCTLLAECGGGCPLERKITHQGV